VSEGEACTGSTDPGLCRFGSAVCKLESWPETGIRRTGKVQESAHIIDLRAVRRGIQGENPLHGRVERKLKEVAGGGRRAHVNDLAVVSERAGFEGRRRHDAMVGQRCGEALSFIVDEPEGLVARNGASGRTAEGVARVRILGHHLPRRMEFVIKEIACAQGVVPPEPVQIFLEVIRATFGDDVHYAADVASEFWKKIAGDDAEFLNRVRLRAVSPGCGNVKPGMSVSLLSVPSRRKLLFRSPEPFTESPPRIELLWFTPGERSAS
jgi:hypothetical protein